jgi:hypothetical protein
MVGAVLTSDDSEKALHRISVLLSKRSMARVVLRASRRGSMKLNEQPSNDAESIPS